MPQSHLPTVIPPSELIALISHHLPPDGGLTESFLALPLPSREALALICLRDLGYLVDPVVRTAYAHRKKEDYLFWEVVQGDELTDPNLPLLLADLRISRTKEQESFLRIAVHALRVEKGDYRWIVDGWGKDQEQDILEASARSNGRAPARYIGDWKEIEDVQLEKGLLRIKKLPMTALLIAACQSHVLSQATASSDAPADSRRI